MSATTFTADLRDIRFALHEHLDIVGQLKRFAAHAELDRDSIDAMLDEGYRVATEAIAPINVDADRLGCTLDGDGNVTTPASFKAAWDTYRNGGWGALSANPEYGGLGMPHGFDVAVGEVLTGASVAFAMFPGLTRGAASLIEHYCSEDVKRLVLPKMFSGEWTGTMCLTEAGAGTDVGSNRAKATPSGEDGVYLIEGEKIFISCGDHDLAEYIIHLVLARTPGSPEGTKGLSIFLVPKFEFDAAGNLGRRNGAYVGKIEHKMGIHGSPTCVVQFGDRAPCKGWLIGKERQGMEIMFLMMNEARLEVGVQGLVGGASAYQYALAYAKDRVQGVSVENFGNAAAPKVTINQHPDVRRMLLWQKVHVETMRSLVYKTGIRIDIMRHATDADEQRAAKGYVELMTPVVKAYCSDKGFEVAVTALQTFGGYGYIGEYPVEQVVRDTKIASIYEGTNGVQAMDLLGRKMTKGSGVLFMNWLQEVSTALEAAKAQAGLAELVEGVDKAKDALGAAAMHLGGLGMAGNLKGAMLQATNFLEMFGNVALAVEAVEQASVASAALAAGGLSDDDARFYKGKLLNLRFYVHNVLPRAIAIGRIIRSGDDSCMDDVLFA